MTDRPKLLALINVFQDLRKLLERRTARAQADRKIENAAGRRSVSILREQQTSSVEDDFRRAMRATSF